MSVCPPLFYLRIDKPWSNALIPLNWVKFSLVSAVMVKWSSDDYCIYEANTACFVCQLNINCTFLTSKPISIATRAGRRRRPLGSDDGSKGTLLFDSRKDGRGEWKDGRSAGGANCWT